MRDERLPLGRRHVDQHRGQQPLTLERTRRQLLHHLLEQHSLVRDVLIDDRNPFVVDRDDERIPELPERDHRPNRVRFYRVLLGSTRFYRVRSQGLHQVAPRTQRLRCPSIPDAGTGKHTGNRHRPWL